MKISPTLLPTTCLSTPLHSLHTFKIPDQLPLRRRGAASGGAAATKKKSLYAENPLYATSTTATTLDTTLVDCPVTPPSNKVAADKSSTEDMNNSSPLSGGGGGAAASSTYGMTPEQASKNFDQLRREATKLERHLEDRVARYQQVRTYNYICCIFCVRLFYLCRYILGNMCDMFGGELFFHHADLQIIVGMNNMKWFG